MAALSTFSNGDRLDYVGPNNFMLNPLGQWIKEGPIARLVAPSPSAVDSDLLVSPDTQTYVRAEDSGVHNELDYIRG